MEHPAAEVVKWKNASWALDLVIERADRMRQTEKAA